MKLWFVGKWLASVTTRDFHQVNANEFVGIFTSEEEAIKHCKDRNYWIGPMEVDCVLPPNEEWSGAYYPLAELEQSNDLLK